MQRIRNAAVLAAGILTAASSAQVHAQAQTKSSESTFIAGVPDSAVLGDLRFRSIGPAAMSGRVADIAVPAPRGSERLGKTIYVASAAGGVWKTTNGGMTWAPIFDGQRVSSIGAVAVAPSDPNIVWVGTGEANNLRSSSWGEGIYKSTDAGKTWTHTGLRSSQHIARVIVHPTNADIVFVAAMGPLWAPGGERGLFRTTDGGRTWTNVKSLGQFTGFTDVTFDPANPQTLYAASYQRDRRAYSFVGGGPESGIWKSMDGGNTWTQLTQGLPTGDKGRIGVSVSKSNPQIVYATVDASDGGIFRSNDGGTTWTRTSNTMSIPWYFGQIRVDPNNPERVYFLGQSLVVSDDGGKNFRNIGRTTHADNHALLIDPNDSDHILLGNDGGFYVSEDRGATWDFAINLPVSTFYAIAYDMRDPYWVFGGIQDNGSWGGPSATRDRNGIGNEEWFRTGGGDGFYSQVDPTDPNTIYAESQEGGLLRMDGATRESKGIRPTVKPGEPALRWNWSAPLLISPHDHNTLYFGASQLLKSTNRGDSWERVSPDLTRAMDRNTMPIMGLTAAGGYRRHDGTAQFGNIATVEESRIRKGLLLTGSDDGVVAVSRDGGANWSRTEKFPGVPDLTYVSRVLASGHNEGTIYATFDGHRSNDFKPYVLKSTDFGKTWTSITSNLPDGAVYVIRESPRNANLLFVGAEYGVFASVNGGKSWARLSNGIAPAPVHDLLIHSRDNDLIVGTHGRGLYVLDDISALEELASPVATAKIAKTRPATIQNLNGAGFDLPGDRGFARPNPAPGAALTYVVGPSAPAANKPVLRINDAKGAMVRELTASLTPGLHRVQWDLRYNAPTTEQPQQRPANPDDDQGGFGPPQQAGGPYVFPGTYTVQLINGGGAPITQTTVEVRKDPAARLTDAEYRDLHAQRLRAYDLQVRANKLLAQLDDAKRRIADAQKGKESSPGAGAAQSLSTEIDSVIASIRGQQRPQGGRGGGGGGGGFGGGAQQNPLARLNGVANGIGTQHFLPTSEQRQTLTEVAAELTKVEPRAQAALGKVAGVIAGLK